MLPWFLLKLQSETHDYSGESFVFGGFFPCVCKSPQHLFYSSHHVSCTELNLNNGGKKSVMQEAQSAQRCGRIQTMVHEMKFQMRFLTGVPTLIVPAKFLLC